MGGGSAATSGSLRFISGTAPVMVAPLYLAINSETLDFDGVSDGSYPPCAKRANIVSLRSTADNSR